MRRAGPAAVGGLHGAQHHARDLPDDLRGEAAARGRGQTPGKGGGAARHQLLDSCALACPLGSFFSFPLFFGREP